MNKGKLIKLLEDLKNNEEQNIKDLEAVELEANFAAVKLLKLWRDEIKKTTYLIKFSL